MMNVQGNQTTRKTARLMISYSRKDKPFIQKLHEGLLVQGFAAEDIWVDWEGIPLTADWMAEITKGIQSANAFIFVISPDSIASEVCGKEIEIAAASNKRFIPILYREPGKDAKLHEKLSAHNWAIIRDEDELDKKLPDLCVAINTDLDWLDRHTQLFNKAKEWESKGRSDSSLLRGNDLQDAVTFISEGAAGKEPAPTPLHIEYVNAARKYAAAMRRRNRIITAVVGVALVALSVVALIQAVRATNSQLLAEENAQKAQENAEIAQANADEAEKAKKVAEANEAEARQKERTTNSSVLAAESINQRDSDTQLSLMLALLSIQETAQDNLVLPESKTALFSSLNTPNVLYTWKTDNAIVWETAYDPAGVYIAIGDDNGLIQIINAESREPVRTIQMDGAVSGLDFSPDGKRLGVSSLDGTASVIDAGSGDELFSLAGHDGMAINDIEFSPDGKWIATAGDDALVKIWNSDTGIPTGLLSSHTLPVTSIDYSPDGTRLISGSRDDTAVVWDAGTGNLLHKLRPDGFVTDEKQVLSVAFSSDGSRVMTGGNYKTVVVWDALTGTEIDRLNGNHASIYDVDFAPDNQSLITASSGVKVWDSAYGTELFNLSSHHGEVNSVAFSSEGDQAVTGSWDYTAKLWAANLKIETLKLNQHNAPNMDANHSPDGNWIFTRDDKGIIFIHNALTGERVDEFSGYSASFNPQNSNLIVIVDADSIAKIWTIGQDDPVRVISDGDTGIWMATFTPDGKVLSISNDSSVKIWDVENDDAPSILGTYSGGRILDILFSTDGTYAVSEEGVTASIWNLEGDSNEPMVTLEGHTDAVLTAVFSHNGKYVYTGGYDNTIRKWDAETGEQLLVITGHTGRVFDLDVSPDDKLISSASADSTVRVWDAETGRELYDYQGNHDESNSAAFSPDGKRVLTASSDKTSREFTIDFDDLLKIAQQYELEDLTKEECQRYLHRDNCTLNLFGQAPSAQPGEPAPAPDETPSLKSGNGTIPVTLVVTNNTSSDVDVFWVDFDGLERYYFTAVPLDIVEQGTYSTHVWRVKDSDGNVLIDYTVTEEPKQDLNIIPDDTAQPAPVTVTETPPADGESFYTEEFDTELDTWESFMVAGTENQVTTSVAGGSLFVKLSPDEDKKARFYLVNPAFDYSSVQLEVETTNYGSNTNGVTLVCNYDGTNWYDFTVSNSGLYSISVYDPEAVSSQGYIELDSGGSAAINTGPAANVYRVVCNGNELALYINDTEVSSFIDTQYNLTSGQIGIGVSSPQMLPVEVSFESLTVSEP